MKGRELKGMKKGIQTSYEHAPASHKECVSMYLVGRNKKMGIQVILVAFTGSIEKHKWKMPVPLKNAYNFRRDF